jgi:hypothetical protein
LRFSCSTRRRKAEIGWAILDTLENAVVISLVNKKLASEIMLAEDALFEIHCDYDHQIRPQNDVIAV